MYADDTPIAADKNLARRHMRNGVASGGFLALIMGSLPASASSGEAVVVYIAGGLASAVILGTGMGVAAAILSWPAIKTFVWSLAVGLVVVLIAILFDANNLSDGSRIMFTLPDTGELFRSLTLLLLVMPLPMAIAFGSAHAIGKSIRKRMPPSRDRTPHERARARWFLASAAILILGGAVAGSTKWLCPLSIYQTKLVETRWLLDALDLYVNRYRAEKGALPENLAALAPTYVQDGLDSWGRPYVYRRVDSRNGYVLYSLGANGNDESGAGDDVLMNKSSKKYSCEDYAEICLSPCLKHGAKLVALLSIILLVGYVAIRAMTRSAA